MKLTPDIIKEFKLHEPIGCRDLDTLKKLKKEGVKSYFSGCLSLSISKVENERKGILFIVDNINNCTDYSCFIKLKESEIVIKELLKNFTIEEIESAEFLSQHSDINLSVEEQFLKAEEWLSKLSKAELVVTTRIHSLMPAIALRTPSFLIIKNIKDSRFKGLINYWNYIDFTNLEKKNKYKIRIKRDKQKNIINKNNYKKISEKNKEIVKAFWKK